MIFWLVVKLEISSRVLISILKDFGFFWRIFSFFEDYIFAW
jgi:hypothetical protein